MLLVKGRQASRGLWTAGRVEHQPLFSARYNGLTFSSSQLCLHGFQVASAMPVVTAIHCCVHQLRGTEAPSSFVRIETYAQVPGTGDRITVPGLAQSGFTVPSSPPEQSLGNRKKVPLLTVHIPLTRRVYVKDTKSTGPRKGSWICGFRKRRVLIFLFRSKYEYLCNYPPLPRAPTNAQMNAPCCAERVLTTGT